MPASTVTSITFENIFLASDFTAGSERALEYAKALAKQYSSLLTVVHVCKPPQRIPIPEGGWIEDERDNQQEEDQLKALTDTLRTEGFDAKSVCTAGTVEATVASLAESGHADLLVVGTHGRTGFDRLLYGSRAESIARRANVPMLLVGPGVPALGNSTWKLEHVLCGVPIRPEAASVAAYAHRLAARSDASFFLYYLDDAHAPARSDERRAIAQEIRKYMQNEGLEKHLHDYAFLHAKPAEELVALAARSKADLIVLAAERGTIDLSRFHQGILAHVVSAARCPVLVIPMG